ncbi:hypothetical protein BSLG_003433 [Batrachochytrium salamandrivorans]|nr:hypothetical protein BSLG_003433 [Batrachochytrium salamandrivorans]
MLWDMSSATTATSPTLHLDGAHDLGINCLWHDTSSDRIYSGSDDCSGLVITGLSNGYIQLWDMTAKQVYGSIQAHTAEINALLLIPSSTTGTATATTDPSPVSSSSGSTRLFSAGNDKAIHEWNLSTLQCVRSFIGHTAYVSSIAHYSSPPLSLDDDGKGGRQSMLLSGSWDGSVRIWDLATGSLIDTLQVHNKSVNAVAVDSERKLLFTGTSDGTTGTTTTTMDMNGGAYTMPGDSSVAAPQQQQLPLLPTAAYYPPYFVNPVAPYLPHMPTATPKSLGHIPTGNSIGYAYPHTATTAYTLLLHNTATTAYSMAPSNGGFVPAPNSTGSQPYPPHAWHQTLPKMPATTRPFRQQMQKMSLGSDHSKNNAMATTLGNNSNSNSNNNNNNNNNDDGDTSGGARALKHILQSLVRFPEGNCRFGKHCRNVHVQT